MNDKIHGVLDGELSARALNPQEAEVLAETTAAIGRVLKSIPQVSGSEIAAAVMTRIRRADRMPQAEHKPAWKAAVAWVWSPRPLTLQWRPAFAGAFAILVIAAVSLIKSPADPVAPATQQVLVQFRLDAPQAHQVELAGNFTSWKKTVSLKRSASGVWTVVLPLTPGVHSYAFVVDGNQWVADPMAQSVSDGFGGTNSQVAVLTPDETLL